MGIENRAGSTPTQPGPLYGLRSAFAARTAVSWRLSSSEGALWTYQNLSREMSERFARVVLAFTDFARGAFRLLLPAVALLRAIVLSLPEVEGADQAAPCVRAA